MIRSSAGGRSQYRSLRSSTISPRSRSSVLIVNGPPVVGNPSLSALFQPPGASSRGVPSGAGRSTEGSSRVDSAVVTADWSDILCGLNPPAMLSTPTTTSPRFGFWLGVVLASGVVTSGGGGALVQPASAARP